MWCSRWDKLPTPKDKEQITTANSSVVFAIMTTVFSLLHLCLYLYCSCFGSISFCVLRCCHHHTNQHSPYQWRPKNLSTPDFQVWNSHQKLTLRKRCNFWSYCLATDVGCRTHCRQLRRRTDNPSRQLNTIVLTHVLRSQRLWQIRLSMWGR